MKLSIRNFRSIRQQDIELAPLTVVYGPNGAGKSSLLYAMLAFKNVVLNPNQMPDGFFNFAFANLGGFKAVVFDHREQDTIELGVTLDKDGTQERYTVSIGTNSGQFSLEVSGLAELRLHISTSFPYPANQQDQRVIKWGQDNYTVTWNGLLAQVTLEEQTGEALQRANSFAALLNAPVEAIRATDFVPLRRGFSKPLYSTVPVSPFPITEDEVATCLTDRYLIGKVSTYLEQISNRDSRFHFQPGTAIFSLDTTDKTSGIAMELVNDGFGVNQLVYLLAKCLRRDADLIGIEEPEIHLHPTAQRKLAQALARMVREEEKWFLISTHSESFLLALLSGVARGELEPKKVACYLAMKEDKETRFERQLVSEEGQVEGGLSAFIEGELEDLKAFLKI